MHYADYEYLLSATLLVCAMFGMGVTLTAREFQGVAKAPQGILLIILMQTLVSPCLALALGAFFKLPREIIVGLLVYAALPGGMFSNIVTFLGRGNLALSVSATSFSSLACLVTTTFVVKAFGSAQLPVNFAMPVGHILSEIGFCLLLPLTLGMAFRRLAPERSTVVAKWSIRASIVMLTLVVIGALSAGRIQPAAYGWRTPLVLVLLMVFSVWTCHLVGRLLRLARKDIFTVCIEVVIRNSHLGVLLKASLFPSSTGADNTFGDGVLFVVLFAGFTSLVIGGVEAFVSRQGWGAYAEPRRNQKDSAGESSHVEP